MSGGVKRVETFCANAGMEEGSPLRLALVTVMQTAETASEAVRGGARGLTPEGEAELIHRVAQAATFATQREADRIVRRSSFTTAAMLAMAGLVLAGAGYGVGRWDGARQGAAALEGATFLAQVAALNDARVLADKCRRTQRQEKGGVACDLPPVWVRR
ncbi:hypothetical protein SAE02_69790 [Skermanella aerolata]|uniref:Uncharacterized protein n=1 Tax=Skermanella aerolata TaxID=393310 RepID=A0A512E278_9PROT|nr:hypothetical protein [Skermanella aerolata]KJB91251.1 hypothetical protein N826_31480 [Skermanella aerolata KACC 11604]GEO42831.1 hypothetical protein SAE02_69790 [Skermanella aerolata]